MYRKNAKGNYRLRASFPITPDLIEQVNAVCLRTGQDFSQVCRLALERHVSEFQRLDSIRAQVSAPRPAPTSPVGGEALNPPV